MSSSKSTPLSHDQLVTLPLTDLNAIIKAHRGPKPGNYAYRNAEGAISKILQNDTQVNWPLVRAAQQQSQSSPSSEPCSIFGVDFEVYRLVEEGKLVCPPEDSSLNAPAQISDLSLQPEVAAPPAGSPSHTSKSGVQTFPHSSHHAPISKSEVQTASHSSHHDRDASREPEGYTVLVRVQDSTTEPSVQQDISLVLNHRGHDGWSNLVSARQLAVKLLWDVPALFASPCEVAWNHPSSTQTPIPILQSCGPSGLVQFGNDCTLPLFEKNNRNWLHVFINKSDGVVAVRSVSTTVAEYTSPHDHGSDDVEMHRYEKLPHKRSLPEEQTPPPHRQSPSPPSDLAQSRQQSHASPTSDETFDTHQEDGLPRSLMSGNFSLTDVMNNTASGRTSPLSRSGTDQGFHSQEHRRTTDQDGSLNMALGVPIADDGARNSTPDTSRVHRSLAPDVPPPIYQSFFPPVSLPSTSHASEPIMNPYPYPYDDNYLPQQLLGDPRAFGSTQELTRANGYHYPEAYSADLWNTQTFHPTVEAPHNLSPGPPYDSDPAGPSNMQRVAGTHLFTDSVGLVTRQDDHILPPSDPTSDTDDRASGQARTDNPPGTTQPSPIVSHEDLPDQPSSDNTTGVSQPSPVVSSTSSDYVQTFLIKSHGDDVGIHSLRKDTTRGRKPTMMFALIQQVFAVNNLCDLASPPNDDPLNPASPSSLIPLTLQDLGDFVKRGPEWVASCQKAVRKLQDTEVMNNPENAVVKSLLERVLSKALPTAKDELYRGGIGKLSGLRSIGPAKAK